MYRDHTVSIEQKQKQTLSQSLSMAIKLTELNGTDILSYLQNEALDNPLIEIVVPETYQNSLDSSYESYNTDFPLSGKSATTVIEATYSSQYESLYDHLKKQLSYEKNIAEPVKTLTIYLISQLDESGFLRIDIDTLIKKFNVPFPLIQDAIALLQSLDPAGIGARTLIECYLLQLSRINKKPARLEEILQKYGDELLHKRLSKITVATQIPPKELYAMLHFIHKLSPAPGKLFNNETTICVYPDLFLTLENNHPILRYADETIPSVRFLQEDYNRYEVMTRDVRDFARQRLSHYKFIHRALEMRKRTLLSVGTFIVTQQLDYFIYGLPLKPLSLKHIAHACHVSVSTASRTVKNKYIHTNKGIYSLGFFLSREFTGKKENTFLSVFQIKQLLTDILNKEDHEHPYSDYQLEKIFQALHISIARRTLTKYRRALKIPDSRYRKHQT